MRLMLRRPAFDRDLALAGAVALAFFVLYAATWQPSWYGDGVGVLHAVVGRFAAPMHPLSPALAMGLARLVPGLGPLASVRVAMIASAALGLGASFLLARRMGAGRAAALGASALAGATPAVWFFATTVEVHAVHLAAVAAACLAALLYGAAAEGRRALPLLGVLLAEPLVIPSHASGVLLIPGLAGLAWWSRRRAGGRELAALVPAVVVAAAAASGRLVSDGLLSSLFDGPPAEPGSFVGYYVEHGLGAGEALVRGWLLPLGLLLPLALVEGVLRARRDPLLGLVLLALILPELIFFTWFGWPERGGYALAVVPAATAGTALLLQRLPPRAGPLALLGVALHAGLTSTLGLAGRDGWRIDDRLEAAALALPEGGTLFSLQARAPWLDSYRPDVTERSLYPLILGARDAGFAPEDFGARFLELAQGGPTAFDIGCLRNEHLTQGGMQPYFESLVLAFEAQPGCRRARAGDWELLAVDLPPRAPAGQGR